MSHLIMNDFIFVFKLNYLSISIELYFLFKLSKKFGLYIYDILVFWEVGNVEFN